MLRRSKLQIFHPLTERKVRPKNFSIMTVKRAFAIHEEIVRPEWIDYNGHMNVAYYILAFDHATDHLFDFLDLG